MAVNADLAALQRRHMVDNQLRPRSVTDAALLSAFDALARETFVASEYAGMAYADIALPAAGETERLLLPPIILARLLQSAKIKIGDRALEVGGGSSYGAAIMALLGARVVALEDKPILAIAGAPAFERVTGDLAQGAPAFAPYDLILVSCGFEAGLDGLWAQLARNGRLVGIDASAGSACAVLLEKTPQGQSRRVLFDATAPVAPAFRRAPAFAF